MSNRYENQHIFWNKEKGFTYLEIILVIAIISYIVVTFAQFIMRSSVADKMSQDMIVASNFAKSKLEQLRASPFYFIGESSGTFFNSGKKYNWSVEVWFMTEELGKLAVAPVMTDLKMANVFINWYVGNDEKNYSASSLFANYGMAYPSGASFSGQVKYSNSEIENAFVGIPNSNINTYTDSMGNYKLITLPGTYSVFASKPGYKSKTLYIENLSFGEERVDVNFLLEPIKE